MIIFYDKKTGDIVGTINGLQHSEAQLKMWIGKDTERKIVEYNYDKKTNTLSVKDNQKALFIDFLEKNKKIQNYKMDLKTKKLIKTKKTKLILSKDKKIVRKKL